MAARLPCPFELSWWSWSCNSDNRPRYDEGLRDSEVMQFRVEQMTVTVSGRLVEIVSWVIDMRLRDSSARVGCVCPPV